MYRVLNDCKREDSNDGDFFFMYRVLNDCIREDSNDGAFVV